MKSFYKKLIQETLRNNTIATLSTRGDDGIWSCPIFYTVDISQKIYFIADTHGKEMKNLWIENKASIAIPTLHAQYSLQMIGEVTILENNDSKNLQKIISYLHSLYGGTVMSPRSSGWKLLQLNPFYEVLVDTNNQLQKILISKYSYSKRHYFN